MDQDAAPTPESKARPAPDSAARPGSKVLETAALALGVLAILSGVGCNAWTLPALIGESSPSLVVFAWVFDVALVLIGLLVIRRKELVAHLLLPVGTSLLLFCGCLSLLDVYVGYRFLVTADRDVTIEDVRELILDPATPPYLYDLEVGLYLPGQGPVSVVADDGHQLAQRVLLSQIRVTDD